MLLRPSESSSTRLCLSESNLSSVAKPSRRQENREGQNGRGKDYESPTRGEHITLARSGYSERGHTSLLREQGVTEIKHGTPFGKGTQKRSALDAPFTEKWSSTAILFQRCDYQHMSLSLLLTS